MTIKDLMQQNGTLHDKMGAIQKKADDESRKMTAEESATWDRMDKDYNENREEILRRQKMEAHAAQIEGRVITPPGEVRPGAGSEIVLSSEEYAAKSKTAFTNYLRYGIENLGAEDKQIMGNRRGTFDAGALKASLPAEIWAKLPPQIRAAQDVGTGSQGGYLVPTGFSGLLETFLKAYGGMRAVSRIFPTPDGRSIPWPTVDDTANTGVIITENSTTTEQDVAFGNVIFTAYKYSSKYVPVSVELLQDSFFDIDSLLAELLAVRIGRITNTHFTVGTGSGQPLGVVTAAGVGTIGAIGESTSLVTNDLYNLEHSVDPAYRPGSLWMFADSTLKAIKLLKDSTGRMLWQPALSGMATTVPDMIDGFPYQINQDMPAMAANAESIAFGDFKKYVIRDCLDITIVRLVELYALLGQVAFLAFSRHDGRILNPNAIKTFQNSAS